LDCGRGDDQRLNSKSAGKPDALQNLRGFSSLLLPAAISVAAATIIISIAATVPTSIISPCFRSARRWLRRLRRAPAIIVGRSRTVRARFRPRRTRRRGIAARLLRIGRIHSIPRLRSCIVRGVVAIARNFCPWLCIVILGRRSLRRQRRLTGRLLSRLLIIRLLVIWLLRCLCRRRLNPFEPRIRICIAPGRRGWVRARGGVVARDLRRVGCCRARVRGPVVSRQTRVHRLCWVSIARLCRCGPRVPRIRPVNGGLTMIG